MNIDGSCDLDSEDCAQELRAKREKCLPTPSKGCVGPRLFYLRIIVGRAMFRNFPGERLSLIA